MVPLVILNRRFNYDKVVQHIVELEGELSVVQPTHGPGIQSTAVVAAHPDVSIERLASVEPPFEGESVRRNEVRTLGNKPSAIGGIEIKRLTAFSRCIGYSVRRRSIMTADDIVRAVFSRPPRDHSRQRRRAAPFSRGFGDGSV